MNAKCVFTREIHLLSHVSSFDKLLAPLVCSFRVNCSFRKWLAADHWLGRHRQCHHWSAWADESGPKRPRISVKRRTVRARATSVADGAGEGEPEILQISGHTNRRRPRRQLAPCRLQAQAQMDQGRQRRALQGRALESPRRCRRTQSSSVCRRTCQLHRHSPTRSRCPSLGR